MTSTPKRGVPSYGEDALNDEAMMFMSDDSGDDSNDESDDGLKGDGLEGGEFEEEELDDGEEELSDDE